MPAPDEQQEAKKPKPTGGAVKAAVKVLASGAELSPAAASDAMRELMAGEAKPEVMGAFLALLSLDRCHSGIIHALADVMRSSAVPVDIPRDDGSNIVDIVGTGGDGHDTFNISTAAGLVAAGAGARVVKHGNRAASSKSGAADILEAMGARLELAPPEVCSTLAASRFAFIFARSYHPAMRHVGPVRQELGIRTVFNILGPLTNPAKPDGIVCGVFSASLGQLFAEVFKMLGMRQALVVHGCDGLDELSIAGPSKVWELKTDGSISHYEVQPADLGLRSTHSRRSSVERLRRMRLR
jgi:anthranilate phosphoribosyltransferase